MTASLILGVNQIGSILERKAKNQLEFSFCGNETIDYWEIKNQKLDG